MEHGGGAAAVRTRAELPTAMTWDLVPLYSDAAAWDADYARLPERLAAVQAWRGRLGESPDALRQAWEADDALDRLIEKLYTYAHLRADEDTADAAAQGRLDRIAARAADIGGETAWSDPEVLALPEAVLAAYLAAPELAFYRRSLSELIRERPHTLSAPEERLLGLASDPLGAPHKTFNLLSNADLRFAKIPGPDGQRTEVTNGNYSRFLECPDRRVRRAAFRAMFDAHIRLRHTFASVLDGSVRTHAFLAKARNFPSARAAALFPDNVHESVYDQLIATVHAHLPALHGYLGLRRNVLGLSHLDMCDLRVPLLPDAEMHVSWDEAARWVRESVHPLGQAYQDALGKAFAERWIDPFECRGKRSGAYSSGCFDSSPYILMNYNGTLNDVFTLAHELGHSLHSWHSRQTQAYHYSGYRIFVAEVASTTNELLLHHHLMARADRREMRLHLLQHLLDEIRGTVYRQTQFAEFEHLLHKRVEEGESWTADALDEAYLALNKTYYGKSVRADRRIACEWARIPHFHYNFYVYKYATGFAAAVALSRGILSGDPAKVAAYLRFLSAGDTKDVLDLLRDAGVDLARPEPVATALSFFADTVAELERELGR
jgi:oligoendopeptidase F